MMLAIALLLSFQPAEFSGPPRAGRARVASEQVDFRAAALQVDLGPGLSRAFSVMPRLRVDGPDFAVEPRVGFKALSSPDRVPEDVAQADRTAIRAVGVLFSRPGGRIEAVEGRRQGQVWRVPRRAEDLLPSYVFVDLDWLGAGNRYVFPVSRAVCPDSAVDLPLMPAPPADPESPRVTSISAFAKGHSTQIVEGYWTDDRRRVWRLQYERGTGIARLFDPRGGTTAWLRPDSGGWSGVMYTEPIDGSCRGQGLWQPVSLRASKDSRRLEGMWRGRKEDERRCCASGTPDGRAVSFTRYSGLGFEPFRPGFYIHTIASPAVGPNPAQFKMAVRLAWDYQALGATRVTLSMWDASAPRAKTDRAFAGARAVTEYVLERHGVYIVEARALDDRGEVLHADYARAELR